MRLRDTLRTLLLLAALALSAPTALRVSGQAPSATLTVISREPHRPIPITVQGGRELVALEDLAVTFQATFRDDTNSLTLSYKGRTIALTPDQTIASVAGRVISLPSPPVRVNGRWLVPLDVISRALSGIYDARIELRRQSRLVILGDLRVPRVTVRHEPSGGGARVSIEVMPRAVISVARETPDRLTIHIDGDAIDAAWPGGQIPGIVLGYRAIDKTTTAIDLGPKVARFKSTLQVGDASNTMVIDLQPQDGSVPTATRPLEPAPPPPVASVEVPARLASGSGVRTVVIDPGHGGDDRGAIGPAGTLEKDLTLTLARRLKSAIEDRLGIRVLMTRDDDRLVAVSDRPALANNNKADLFVSLHANGSQRPEASGATIYVADFPKSVAGGTSTSARPAERLLAYGGMFRDIELVTWNLAQAGHRDQSQALADLLADEFRDRVPMTATPVEQAPLRVLQSANMPAILIESGFLTNPDQERALNATDFQSTLAQAIVDAIVRFRSRPGQPHP
ncbi:MAG: N-acetylmuramoyl-L-alanine amidase [Vicinamibacterales bacterium]